MIISLRLSKRIHEDVRDRIAIPQEDPDYRRDNPDTLDAIDEAWQTLDHVKPGEMMTMSRSAWLEVADWMEQWALTVADNAEWGDPNKDPHKTYAGNMSYAARLERTATELRNNINI